MSINTCEWGNGNQCPDRAREDGSIYAQLCDDHACVEAGLNHIEWGDVCLWCAAQLPSESANPCEDGNEHCSTPAGFPFHSESEQDRITGV